MPEPTPLLRFVQDELQLIALAFMAAVYAWKVRWILKFPTGRDRQAPGGDGPAGGRRGARHSLFAIALPWEMASTRRHPLLYAQFVAFHLGVALSIAMSFVIPYAPGLMQPRAVAVAAQAVFALAFATGVLRMARRVRDPYVRAISTPDDFFSLALLVVWLAFSFLAAPHGTREWPRLVYFLLTAFFLVYVPFSKISHYLYYPFARWYLGRTMGHRGVYPLRRRGHAPSPVL